MAKALTARAVEALKPEAKRREYPDAALPGLYLVVQPSGAKSWALRYRYAGRPVKLTLGRWPMMGVADARVAATEAIDKIERGGDPAAERKATKAAQREALLTERDKIKTLIEQYDRRHLSTLRSRADVKRTLDRHVVAAWGERDIHEITKRDILDLLDGIADSGRITTANRVRAYMSKFFNWCVERDVLDASPALGVKAVAKETSRDRVLTDDEIRWLWQAADAVGFPWGPLARVLLLTGQRLGEVSGMQRDEIDGALWHLPSARVKNGRAHDVPLSGAVVEVLEGMPQIGEQYLFTTTGRSPVSGTFKGRNRLAAAMEQVATKEKGEPVEIPHWSFHDLRRTAATGMARLGIPVRVTEAVMNHVSGTGGGIVAVYQRHDYADEKRQALDAWARFVMGLVEGEAGNVVPLDTTTHNS